jgi:hypothetical protein
MPNTDDRIRRRRALAARVVTLAGSVEIAVAGALELGCRTPPAILAMPPELRRWAAQIQATRNRP